MCSTSNSYYLETCSLGDVQRVQQEGGRRGPGETGEIGRDSFNKQGVALISCAGKISVVATQVNSNRCWLAADGIDFMPIGTLLRHCGPLHGRSTFGKEKYLKIPSSYTRLTATSTPRKSTITIAESALECVQPACTLPIKNELRITAQAAKAKLHSNLRGNAMCIQEYGRMGVA